MRRSPRGGAIALLLVASLSISGCSPLFPSSLSTIDGCVDSFMDYLDTQTSLIPKEIASSDSDYSQTSDPSFWVAAGFPANETFSLEYRSIQGNTLTATLVSTKTYRSGAPIVFDLIQLADGDYAISTISVNGVYVLH